MIFGGSYFVARCVIMSNLALPKTGCTSAESKQAWLCSRFALFFESRTQSRTAEQAERRIKRSLNYAEAKPALAAKQQQYAPSFSLSAPCILLTLTRRLRVISNAYFDTPSAPRICSPKNHFYRVPVREIPGISMLHRCARAFAKHCSYLMLNFPTPGFLSGKNPSRNRR